MIQHNGDQSVAYAISTISATLLNLQAELSSVKMSVEQIRQSIAPNQSDIIGMRRVIAMRPAESPMASALFTSI